MTKRCNMGTHDAETVENYEAIWPKSMKLPKFVTDAVDTRRPAR